MSEISDEFKDAAKKINAKLAEAAEALREAIRLSDEAGLKSLIPYQDVDDPDFDKILASRDPQDRKSDLTYDIYKLIQVSEFERAMDYAGWSSSSSYC